MKIVSSIIIGTCLHFLILIGLNGAYARRECLSNPEELKMEHVDGDHYAHLASLDFTTTTVQLDDFLNTKITTRVHQSTNNPITGVVTSPTIRVKRGTKLEIKLRNLLEPTPDCGDVECVENTLKKPNLTNMHTHGLHVSGAVKGDDIMHIIDGGEEHTYIWNIPCDHPGGTAWYHPHAHGNSVIQVGGGAAGALIVEDDVIQDGFPSWVTDPSVVDPEAVLVLQHLENQYITKMGKESTPNDKIFSYEGSTSIWLVNSVYNPEICMTAGKWRRWRMVHVDTRSGHNLIIEPQEGTTGTCEIQLFAKDAVTISPAPRPVSGIYFSVSGRVDVMVHCPAGNYNLIGLDQGVIATIVSVSVEGIPSTPSTLTIFETIRPPFLRDTFDEVVTTGVTPLVDASEDAIMGVSWNPSNPPLVIMPVNGVQEWDVIDVGYHPFHLHVHHVQLMADTQVSGIVDWGRRGDWLDVVDQNSRVRFRTDRFGGPAIMHCHVLEHEDKGSMGLAYVVGGCDALYNDLEDGGAECDATCPNLIPTAPPQCYTNDQCEGTDKCDDNVCVPQCSSDVECAVQDQLCNVEAGKCVECMVEDNCEGNFMCVNNKCEAECMKSDDCSQDNFLCYEHKCIPECTSGSDCRSDQFCVSNKCVACQTDDNCEGTWMCSDETYQCQPQCTEDYHCGGNLLCSDEVCSPECTNNNDCEDSLVCLFDICSAQCVQDSDCSDDDDVYCIGGVCGECETNGHCSGNDICTDYHICEPQCSKASDCAGSMVCDVNQVCIYDCLRDEECPGSLICSNNICEKECDDDTDCATGHRCSSNKCAEICSVDLDCPLPLLCSSENTCVECMSTSQCSSGYHCDASYACTSSICESDSDCLITDTCVTGMCMNQEEAQKVQPLIERWQFWASVAFIGSGSVALTTSLVVWLKQ